MSQALENNDITGAYIGRGDPNQPQSAPAQEPRGMSNSVDGSGPIFSMYLDRATEEDDKMVEGWKADADGILIFTGLFSAAVASLISVTIQDIRPNLQDTSNFYLANIYRATLADPGSNISASLPASPPPFSPPKYAVWVNTLLFLSLVISITCALLATLLQQWARRYLKVTQPRYSLHKRARIRAFFAEGVDNFLLPSTVEALPTLLHVSLFLFFSGISVFLWNVDLTIFKSVVSWIGICTALYGCITFVPIFHHDSPYHTPLSLPAWNIVTAIPFVTLRLLQWFALFAPRCVPCFSFGPFSLDWLAGEAYDRFESLEGSYRKLLVQGLQKTIERTALDSPSETDTRAFLWTFDSLDEDHELERFFSALPGFRSSKVVDDPLPRLTEEQIEKLSTALTGLFDRTFSSDLLPESVKHLRAIICARALDPVLFHEHGWVMNSIMFGDKCVGLQTSKFGCIVRGWGNGGNGSGLVTQAIVTNIIAGVQQRDDSWFILASSALGVPESVLRGYAANSLSLAIVIHIARQQFDHFREPFWPYLVFYEVLKAASIFDVQDTAPELQHEFCSLWNKIVLKAQNDDDRSLASHILEPIRHVYDYLHPDTDSAPIRVSASTGNWDSVPFSPFSYPVCNVAGHINDISAPTTFACTILDDNAALVASIANLDAPPLSMSSPPRAIESLAGVPPLDDFHPVHQKTVDGLRPSATSPDAATAGTVRDIITSSTEMPHSTLEYASPLSPTSLPAALWQNAEPLIPSEPLNFLPRASSNQVLSIILPTESCLPMIATAAPSASTGPTSVPDLGVAAEDDGSRKPGLGEDKDGLDLPSVNRAIPGNTMSTLYPPPQSPSLPSVADSDVVITGCSPRGPIPERTGDPPHPSHYQYDIV